MAAKDYEICEVFFDIYLVKKIKSGVKMSQDRRPLTIGEQIGPFEHYLRKYCKENKTDTVVITNSKGVKVFEATLLDVKQQEGGEE